MINFANPLSEYNYLKKDIDKAVFRTLKSNDYILGDEVKKFQINFSKRLKSRFCIATSNGTDALIIAIKSLNIKRNDKIIVPSHTATATVSAIIESGAIPIFADIKDDFNIDLDKISSKDLIEAKAIILVHLYGNPCEIDKALILKRKYNLKIIEDCSQAHFAIYKKKYVGCYGDVSCFSFYPTKNLSALGDAGAIITNNQKIFQKCKILREYGWKKKNYSVMHGTNKRMDEIQASILNVKLKKILFFNNKRRDIAKFYFNNIYNKKIILPNKRIIDNSVFHLFVIRVPKRERKLIIDKFKRKNIQLGIHYIKANHQQKPYKQFYKNNLHKTNELIKEIISIPIYPLLKIEQMKKIVNLLNKI